jgi:ribosomal protein S18 acetylase RimI-like enzyme
VALQRFYAGPDDDPEFTTFTCWDGDPEKWWAQEAQNSIRNWILRPWLVGLPEATAFKWCDDGELVGVAAIGTRVLTYPQVAPRDHVVGHIDLLAVSLPHQREGVSRVVLGELIDLFREDGLVLAGVTADVHQDNTAALAAAAEFGITKYLPKDDDGYWILFGELE